MNSISQTVTPFLKAIKTGEPISITPDGCWFKKGIVRRVLDLFRQVFFGYDPSLENAKNLVSSISSAAKAAFKDKAGISRPTTWDPDDLKKVVESVKSTLRKNVDNEEKQIQALVTKRDILKASPVTPSLSTVIAELNRKISTPESWSYRATAANLDRAYLMNRYLGIDQRNIDFSATQPEDEAWVEQELLLWQKDRFPYVEYLVEEQNEPLRHMIRSCRTAEEFSLAISQNLPLLDQCCETQFHENSSVQPQAIKDFLSQNQTKRKLRKIFLQWKKHETILQKIHTCCCYPEFISAARQNRALLDMCFNTVFKSMPDECADAIAIFLQAPMIQEQLRKTFLDKRIREVANQGIRFVQYTEGHEGKPIKAVQLLIDGEYQSITDENSTIRVAKDVHTTVGKMFEEFVAQNVRFIEMEYLQDSGVTLFDGRRFKADLSKKEWWKELPVIKRMTREQIEDAYDTDFQKGEALFVIRASRTTPDLRGDGSHAWADLLVPLGDGTFNCLSIGKYSNWFPVGLLETFNFIFHTHEANVTVVDPNTFMSSRDRISVPLPPINKDQLEQIMEDLRKELIRSRNHELIFQAQGDNCALWIRHFIQRNWQGLSIEPYQIPVQDLIVPNFLMPIIWARHIFPTESAWQWFRIGFCSIFGAMSPHALPTSDGRSRNISLFNNEDWRRGLLQIPARLWMEKERILSTVNKYMKGQAATFRQPSSREQVA
jgi:hypothetical protein